VTHPICWLLGHNGETYSYQSGLVEHEYVECARCGARKNLSGRGWIDDAE